MSWFVRRYLVVTFIVALAFIAALPPVTHAAPAPPLSYLQVLAVQSANSPFWEYPPSSQFTTTVDHGGSWLLIATEEYGYGQSRIAKFNGVTVPQHSSQALTDSGGTIIGWIRTWRVTGPITSGQFTYQSTSINSPWNTMSDWINVK